MLTRRQRIAVCAVALVSAALVGCHTNTTKNTPMSFVAPTLDARKLAAGYNEFGFRLLRALAQGNENENVCLSPFSVATALAMTANGTAGQTRRELDTLLGTSSLNAEVTNAANQNLSAALRSADTSTTLNIASSLWVDRSAAIKPDFVSLTKQFFDAPAENVDLQSNETLKRINGWASDKTAGKIPTILDQPLSSLDILVLLNAVYFKGEWTEKFEAAQTKPAPFHAPDGDRPLDFMQKSSEFNYFEDETLQAVALPYGNERFAMWLALPKPKNTIDTLLAKTNAQTWQSWTQKATNQEGMIKLPKMKLSGTENLEKIIPTLGAPSAFDKRKADFSPLTSLRPTWIDLVRHKVIVEVDEEGTIAAAVTAVAVAAGSAAPSHRPFVFVADRPFLMAIQERETGSILFLCRVVAP